MNSASTGFLRTGSIEGFKTSRPVSPPCFFTNYFDNCGLTPYQSCSDVIIDVSGVQGNAFASSIPLSGGNNSSHIVYVSGNGFNSQHFGILKASHPPCDLNWNYGVIYRTDGAVFVNVNPPLYWITPMAVGGTYSMSIDSGMLLSIYANGVFQISHQMPLGTPLKWWCFGYADGITSYSIDQVQ